jgi:hypothetical protein
MALEKRCYVCKNVWQVENHPDPPFWGILYDFCGKCRKAWMEKFEAQFRQVLRLSK